MPHTLHTSPHHILLTHVHTNTHTHTHTHTLEAATRCVLSHCPNGVAHGGLAAAGERTIVGIVSSDGSCVHDVLPTISCIRLARRGVMLHCGWGEGGVKKEEGAEQEGWNMRKRDRRLIGRRRGGYNGQRGNRAKCTSTCA